MKNIVTTKKKIMPDTPELWEIEKDVVTDCCNAEFYEDLQFCTSCKEEASPTTIINHIIHPNIKIYHDFERGNLPYMNIQKSRETENEASVCLTMAGFRLENGEIKELKVNGYFFTRTSFELKNGRWNQTLYNKVAVSAYEIEAIKEIINH